MILQGGGGGAAARRDRQRSRGFTWIEGLGIVAVVGVLIGVAIPMFSAGQMATREDTAIAHLRLLKTVMEQYPEDNETFADEVVDLLDAGYVSGFQVWGNDLSRSGYLFHLEPGPDPAEWAIQANPVTPGYTGTRFFRLNFLGEIRWNEAGPATASDPPLLN